ncbi:MAG: fasciclin domain-containing protein [Pseudomonadota bacterium]
MNLGKIVAFSALSILLMVGTANAHPKNNIVEVASKAGKFKTLLAAAKKAGLVSALIHKGPITVFAPTDKAFAKLSSKKIKYLLKPKNRAKLKRILLYHVIPGKVLAADVPRLPTKVKTLSGDKIVVDRDIFDVEINNAHVKKADIIASNGVIHVINKVLLPPKMKRHYKKYKKRYKHRKESHHKKSHYKHKYKHSKHHKKHDHGHSHHKKH